MRKAEWGFAIGLFLVPNGSFWIRTQNINGETCFGTSKGNCLNP